MNTSHVDIVVVGLGPVGLFMTYLLAQSGLKIIAVEKRIETSTASRSIGIHPPLLEVFKNLGLLEVFLKEGIKIRKTELYKDKKCIFSVDLGVLDTQNKFVLSIPQYKTEEILANKLRECDNVEIIRGSSFVSLQQNNNEVSSSFENNLNIRSKFLIACDGNKSVVRDFLNIPMLGKDYEDFYSMADFKCEESEQETAYITLGRDGLLEVFPLTKSSRRWVVRIAEKKILSIAELTDIIQSRKPENLQLGENINDVSSFVARDYSAERYYKDRVVLVGDAAHVVSPIGGQGMNLGWLGALNLVEASKGFSEVYFEKSFKEYQRRQQKARLIVSRRASFNMSFGRPSILLGLKVMFLKKLLQSVFAKRLTKQFTMGDL